mgnify:CR=1 FL=1
MNSLKSICAHEAGSTTLQGSLVPGSIVPIVPKACTNAGSRARRMIDTFDVGSRRNKPRLPCATLRLCNTNPYLGGIIHALVELHSGTKGRSRSRAKDEALHDFHDNADRSAKAAATTDEGGAGAKDEKRGPQPCVIILRGG